MAKQKANEILEYDRKDLVILCYLGRKVFRNEKERQWWLANSEFTEHDIDLILNMAGLFRPVDASDSDDSYRVHINPYFSYSDDQIVGADSPVTYSRLRDLVKRIRISAAFRESLGHLY